MTNGWKLKQFESCIESVKYPRRIQRKDFLDEGKFPVISQEAAFTNGFWNNEADAFKVSTPVVIFGDHTQVLKYVDFDFVLGADGVKILQPRTFLCPKFFYYQLRAANLKSLGYARHYRVLKQLDIAVPPLPEQQRIVRLLDAALDDVASARTNCERNIQNVGALHDSYLQSVFHQRTDGSVERRLRDVAESISTGPFGTMLHKSDYVLDGIPVVNPMNIIDSQIVPSRKMMVSEETRDRLIAYALKPGDIVIGRRGELGRCALVTEHEAGWLCGTGSFVVRLSDVMLGEFFVALFGSDEFKARLEMGAVGATMSSLNHAILNDLKLPVPPVPEQRMIMDTVHKLRAETRRLSRLYERKLEALRALENSLLHQALSGELREQPA